MLAALCLGVLLVGIELFITAVALPRIIVDLSGWTDLRRASWIITAYLIAYIAATPLAGRAADRFGLPALMMASLALFALGSLLAGAAQSLEQLVVARAVQGAGAGAIVPLATAGASHLYTGHARSRALGLVGAATFLGMALGPLLGALVLENLQLRDALAAIGIWGGPLVDLLVPSWRWVFYLTAPLSACWPSSTSGRLRRAGTCKPGRASMDALGAALFTVALTSGLLAITLMGEQAAGGACPWRPWPPASPCSRVPWPCRRMLRTPEPFLDLRLFARPRLLRRRPGQPADRLRAGHGHRGRGHLRRPRPLRRPRGAGHRPRAAGPGHGRRRLRVRLRDSPRGRHAGHAGRPRHGHRRPPAPCRRCASTRSSLVPLGAVSLFGLGFGLTVTPRTTAAVEAAGRAAFGMASGIVTVARMVGMAFGMAILTAFATTRIDAVSVAIEDQAFRDTHPAPRAGGLSAGRPARARRPRALGLGRGSHGPRAALHRGRRRARRDRHPGLAHARSTRVAPRSAPRPAAGTPGEPSAASSGRDARRAGRGRPAVDSDEDAAGSPPASEPTGSRPRLALLARHVAALVREAAPRGQRLRRHARRARRRPLGCRPSCPAARRALRRLAVDAGRRRSCSSPGGPSSTSPAGPGSAASATWATTAPSGRVAPRGFRPAALRVRARAGLVPRRLAMAQRLSAEVPARRRRALARRGGQGLGSHLPLPDGPGRRRRPGARRGCCATPWTRARLLRPLRRPALAGAAPGGRLGQGHRTARGSSRSSGRAAVVMLGDDHTDALAFEALREARAAGRVERPGHRRRRARRTCAPAWRRGPTSCWLPA